MGVTFGLGQAFGLGSEVVIVLVELSVVEQRFRAVQEVLDGVPVTEAARRYQVARQTVHRWLRRYAEADGLAGLADRSSRPGWCPHQMPPVVEARVVALRIAHPAWGPARLVYELRRGQVDPVPSRSGVYRALVRHRLIDPTTRKRRRGDYRRWERDRPMELWQMDVMGGLGRQADRGAASALTPSPLGAGWLDSAESPAPDLGLRGRPVGLANAPCSLDRSCRIACTRTI